MKRDLDALESDHDLIAPPFVTRCTTPPTEKQRRDAFDQTFNIFAKFEQSFKHNFGESL